MRFRQGNSQAIRADGEFVVYWMTAFRRPVWNFSLDRAVDWSRQLGKPLVVLEALRCEYRWASDRFHRFVLDGMADNSARFAPSNVLYYPYVETAPGAGKGLLEALASRACVVVTDDFPAFFLPRMVAAAARRIPVRLEAVDSNGLLPMRDTDRVFETAYSFRRHLQKTLPPHLQQFPKARPLAGAPLPAIHALPAAITSRWPRASAAMLDGAGHTLDRLPLDHTVGAVASRGGFSAGRTVLERFLDDRLADYGDKRNEPEAEGSSGLSPWLHFGHISVHEVFAKTMEREGWSPLDLAGKATGSRTGWWGVGSAAESFLDELITWRELGFNMCAHRTDHDRYESLPAWALRTLAEHASDPRSFVYTLDQLAASRTHDPLWNAAQSQLAREGRIHNYLRMLWGKKILEWSASPREALEIMIELNNRYALDGRDPNSYTGIFWVLGRYDRPWAPRRPIFGTVRYMSSENTARKFRVRNYIRAHAGEQATLPG